MKGECKWEREKDIGGNKRGLEPVASVYSAAQPLERGDLPMRQNRQPKKGEQRTGHADTQSRLACRASQARGRR